MRATRPQTPRQRARLGPLDTHPGEPAWLGNNNKQSAPVTWKSQRELPGKRKTDGQPENEFIHFLVCPAVFRCALCAQHASEAGCPEAMDYDFVSHAVSNFYGDKRRFSASLLTQKRSVSSSPPYFCFSVSCFNQGIVSIIGLPIV